jgi:aldehyde dehydrogenase (NAD+)
MVSDMMVSPVLERLELGSLNGGACGQDWIECRGKEHVVRNPATNEELGRIKLATTDEYEKVAAQAQEVFREWRMLPAPKRGQIVRDIAEELRAYKQDLGALITMEVGKILAEGLGEVQEMIDIGDFAVGLSRQLYGLTMPSERPGHRMYEQWHPLGLVGVISAFNFPAAVWSWNALIAAVCGDCVIWKPSLKAPLTSIAVQNICLRVLQRHCWAGVLNLVIGTDDSVGLAMLNDSRLPLISATGSTRMGRIVAQTVGRRLGRTLLELGGNNGVIVTKDANLDLAVRAVLFGAVGTAGQRCTTIRRLFVEKGIAERFLDMLMDAYAQIKIGDPMQPDTLMGPLIDREAVMLMMRTFDRIISEGGQLICGGDELGGCFVEPAIVRAHPNMPILREEIFAPILYMIEFEDLEEVIEWHNDVPQGLSSAMFTNNLISAEKFLSTRGSDCGIANINIGTSGAEIGGAFGGEKDTGGGRESGSDAWKAYMRRQTVTINWSNELPLAQGIEFSV